MEDKLLNSEGQDEITPFDSVSQISKRSSLASEKLRKQQRKAELLAKARALKKKQQLELAKFKLELEEQALDLRTELEISEAQTNILDQYSEDCEQLSSSYEHHLSDPEISFKRKYTRSINKEQSVQQGEQTQRARSRTVSPTAVSVSQSVRGGNNVPVSIADADNGSGTEGYKQDHQAGTARSRFDMYELSGHVDEVINNVVKSDFVCDADTPAAAINRSGLNVHVPPFRPQPVAVSNKSDHSIIVSKQDDRDRLPSYHMSLNAEPPLLNTNPFSPDFKLNLRGNDDINRQWSDISYCRNPAVDVYGSQATRTGNQRSYDKPVVSKLSNVTERHGDCFGGVNLEFDRALTSGIENSHKVARVPTDSHAEINDLVRDNHGAYYSQGGNEACLNDLMNSKSDTRVISGDTDIVLNVIKEMRKPSPDIKKFGGDPLEYNKFMRQFRSKVVTNTNNKDEMMTFLEQFTVGEANKIVQGFSYLDAELGYDRALHELEERYGNDHVIASAFVKRALDWPIILNDKPKALDNFAIFLAECNNAVNAIEAVRVLEYPDNIKKLVSKLPLHLHDKWRNLVQKTRDHHQPIKFHLLAAFVREEAKKVNDPVYGKEALSSEFKQSHSPKPRANAGQGYKPSSKSTSKASFATDVLEKESIQNIKGQKGQGHRQMNRRSGRDKPCIYCSDLSHYLTNCKDFARKSQSEKTDFLKLKGLCFGCFRDGHQKRFCRVKETCAKCQGKHPTVLHFEAPTEKIDRKEESDTSADVPVSSASAFSTDMGAGENDVAMAIIPVKVKMRNNTKVVETYAFLDPGSSVSFCSQKLMNDIGGTGHSMKITIDTMGVPHTMLTSVVGGVEVYDLGMNNCVKIPKVYTKDKMPVSQCHIPTVTDIKNWPHLRDFRLPKIEGDIGLLLGNNIPDAYSPLELKTGPSGSPHAVSTCLGWVIWNLIRRSSVSKGIVNRAELLAVQEVEDLKKLDTLVRKAINMDFPENTPDKKEPSQHDKIFMEKVKSSMQFKDRHYQVALPFREEKPQMPNNVNHALQRLKGLKNKMKKNLQFKNDYSDFMNKIIENGCAERIPDNEIDRNDGKVWYIYHHGVYNTKKPGKIRVVFDCSAKFQGISLNSQLLPGPDLTNSLVGVLIRFRQESVALMSDIESMFYQVKVPASEQDYLRFLWWPDGNIHSTPVPFRMKVHIFGAVSSASVANAALRQITQDHKHEFAEEILQTVLKNFYVDDCIKSVDSEEKAISVAHNLIELCNKGGFHLTKWISNSRKVIDSIPQEERAKEVKMLNLSHDELPNERALGVGWNVHFDTLGFKIQVQTKHPTRRGILSIISSIYDPLGLVAPFVLPAKLLLQDLCRRQVEWDAEISDSDTVKWEQWLKELPQLENVEINRCYKPTNFGKIISCEVHNFADASNVGYGVATYIRLLNDKNDIHCCLIMGKARVAPLKVITIPRMELTAAMIAVKINQLIQKEIEYPITNTYFWTDSMSVIRYVNNESTRFHTFVANRINTIRELSDVKNWRYVATTENPADDASRGMTMEKFIRNERWFKGPDFLWRPKSDWPYNETSKVIYDDDPEIKKIVTASIAKSCGNKDPRPFLDRLMNRYSDWVKLKRVVAWFQLTCLNLKKWVKKRKEIRECLNQTETEENKCEAMENEEMKQFKLKEMALSKHRIGKITLGVEALENAEMSLVRYAQQTGFHDEIKFLENKSTANLKRSSPFYKLDPIMVKGFSMLEED